IKTPPKPIKKPQINSGPFKKSLDLSKLLPYLNLRNIKTTFENSVLSIKISKIDYNNYNNRFRIF
ncbi:expressed protein, partial [Dictyostelium purpureum]